MEDKRVPAPHQNRDAPVARSGDAARGALVALARLLGRQAAQEALSQPAGLDPSSPGTKNALPAPSERPGEVKDD